MIVILSQDRKKIINTEGLIKIYASGARIYVRTADEDAIQIGIYVKPENIIKVMNYIGFSLAAADKGSKTIVMPSEEVVNNDKEIAERYIKAKIQEKIAKEEAVESIECAPIFKEIFDRLKGGEM